MKNAETSNRSLFSDFFRLAMISESLSVCKKKPQLFLHKTCALIVLKTSQSRFGEHPISTKKTRSSRTSPMTKGYITSLQAAHGTNTPGLAA